MFTRSIQICHCLQVYFLFILLIDENYQAFVLSHPSREPIERNIRAINETNWKGTSNDQSKDKLNMWLIKDIRSNIMKTAFLIAGGILILFVTSGLVSVIVYYVKKK